MRFDLDLYVNQRPFVGTAPGHSQPHDFVVIRENTEGPYVGEGGVLRKGTPHEVATQGSVNTRMGAERAIRFAFDLAVQRGDANPAGRRHVTLVHKTNVLTFRAICGSGRLMPSPLTIPTSAWRTNTSRRASTGRTCSAGRDRH